MHWAIVLTCAFIFGWLVSFVTRRYGMGAVVTVPIAVLGAGLGGALDRVIFNLSAPAFSFYGLSALLCLLAVGGGAFAFLLTSSERRV